LRVEAPVLVPILSVHGRASAVVVVAEVPCRVVVPAVRVTAAAGVAGVSRSVGYPPAVTEMSAARLDAMVEDATVDCHDEDEQASGLYTMIADNLALPFQTVVLGVDVTVEDVDLTDRGEIVALCSRGQFRQPISILDLPLPVPPPEGAEWIDAYRRWAS
jgi:hypothetical protein